MKWIFVTLIVLIHSSLVHCQFGTQRIILEQGARVPMNSVMLDIDLDGLEDVVVSLWTPQQIVWFRDLGDGNFGEPEILIENTGLLQALALGDIDGDGDLDLVAASWSPQSLRWWPRNGSGFGPVEIIDASISQPTSILLMDLDDDGDLDLVVTGRIESVVKFFLNTGAGSFDAPVVLNDNAQQAMQAVSGDLDGDGLQDIVVASQLGSNITWHRALGGGSFAPAALINSQVDSLTTLALGDMNGDGHLDVVFGSAATDQLVWQQNLGDGTFGQVHIMAGGINNVNSIQLVDLNMDGAMDALCTSFPDNIVRLYMNSGGGLFEPAIVVSELTRYPMSLWAYDMDGDGTTDIGYLGYQSHDVAWHRNLGGTLGPQQQLTRQVNGASWITTADLDGDGDLDVISSSRHDHRIAWYENLGAGNFGLQQNISINTIDAYCVAAADVDGDGVIDLVSASRGTHTVFLHKGVGNGEFLTPVPVTSEATNVERIRLFDLDNDGDLDLVTVGPSQLKYQLNDGDGGFSTPVQFTGSISGTIGFDIADMDDDGLPDIVHTTSGYSRLAWYRNLGDGNFSPQITIASNVPEQGPLVACADINGDGIIDILLGTGALRWYPGLGEGLFDTHINIGTGQWRASVLQVHDVDGDGSADVLWGNGTINAIHLRKNDGGGSFGPLQALQGAVDGPTSLHLANIRGNGARDLIGTKAGALYWYPNYHNSKYKIHGRRYHDIDGNGAYDDGEPGLSWGQVQITPNLNSVLSNANGQYVCYLDTGSYQVTSNITSPFWVLTTSPTLYQVSLTDQIPEVNGIDFGFQATVDTSLIAPSLTWAEAPCGGPTSLWFGYANQGTLMEEGTITLQLDEAYGFLSSEPAPDQINGNTLTWTFTDLGPFEIGTIHLSVILPSIDLMGTLLTTNGTVNSNVSGHTFTATTAVVHACSYDPNDKLVDPPGYGQHGAVDIATDHLEYTIRFQNTGTAHAFHVMLRDVLPQLLQTQHLELVAYSHAPSYMALEPGGELVVRFENIMLPPQYLGEAESQGFIRFRLPLEPGLPHLTQFQNTAEIFFDLNPPIITNMAITTLIDCDLWWPDAEIAGVELLQADAGDHHQWSLNGEPLAGANEAQLQAPSTGVYTCEITSIYGCVAVTDPVFVIVTSVAEHQQDGLRVFPNPYSDHFTVEASELMYSDQQIVLMDLQGRQILQLRGNGSKRMIIPRNGIAPGVYLLRMIAPEGHSRELRIIAE